MPAVNAAPERDGHWHATKLATYGFRVLPIRPGQKHPPMAAWQEAATSEQRSIDAWWKGLYRGFGVGIATGHLSTGRRFFVLDIDDREHHSGSDTLHELEERYGKLPETITSITGSGGEHRFLAVPDGYETPRNDQSGKLGPGLDIRGEGGQVVVAPTVHPNGRTYTWEDGRSPARIEMAEAPAWLMNLLKPPPERTAPRSTPIPLATPYAATSTPADRFNQSTTWDDMLTADGWTFSHERDGEQYWTRPGKDKREGTSATIGWQGNDALKVFTSGVPWLEAERTYSRFQYFAARHHQGDYSAAAHAIIDRERASLTPRAALSVVPNGDEAVADDPVWSERWYLEHIRDAARSRMVAPYAVFGCVVARVAAFTPPSTCLPPIVGGRAPLSLYIALHGASGAGKSSPVACATDLLPEVPVGCVGPLGLGSGEGLVEAYMDLVEETDGDGKKRKVKRQVHRGALFTLDEGQMLAEIGSRKGSTILPVLRTAWSGDDPGQANASIETRRTLRKGNYHIGLISLWQDKAGAALIEDVDGGTPQRFIWLPTTDPAFPDVEPEWPGEIDMMWPATIAIGGVAQPTPMGLADEIRDEIKRSRREVIRGRHKEQPLDAHRRLNKLKLSAVLALLDGRYEIGTDDWRIAEHFMCISDAVRDTVLDRSRQRLADEMQSEAKRYAMREVVASDMTAQRALERAARAVWKAATKAGADGARRRDITVAIASRDRALVTVEEAIEEAVRLSWVAPIGDAWAPGKARPS